jgi:AcrR family transcriptional regulator
MKALAELKPGDLGTDGDRWQQRKSAQTRVVILEATIKCLEKYGYARVTSDLIVKEARISRGAMLHHYASRHDLIVGAIDYIFYRRMQRFTARIASLTEKERIEDIAGLERYWECVQAPEFAAYIELAIAARTDPELRKIFLPKAKHYEAIERRETLRVFPEWQNSPTYDLAVDFCIASMEGLLIQRDIWDDESRRRYLRDFVARILFMLHEGPPESLGSQWHRPIGSSVEVNQSRRSPPKSPTPIAGKTRSRRPISIRAARSDN